MSPTAALVMILGGDNGRGGMASAPICNAAKPNFTAANLPYNQRAFGRRPHNFQLTCASCGTGPTLCPHHWACCSVLPKPVISRFCHRTQSFLVVSCYKSRSDLGQFRDSLLTDDIGLTD